MKNGIPGGKGETATSGLWEITVTSEPATLYRVEAKHPNHPPVSITDLDPYKLAWKMVGQQIRITNFTWDHPIEEGDQKT